MDVSSNFPGWESRHATSDKPIVRVTWFDASQCSREYLKASDVHDTYKAGLLDDTVGYLVGETESFYVLADSFEGDSSVLPEYRQYRSIRNIPKVLVVEIQELTPSKIKGSE